MSKTVLITGANRGLGLSLAYEFALAGYGLLLHCRHGEDQLVDKFPGCRVVIGDLHDQQIDTIEKLSAAASETGLDVLVNNAGIYLGKPFPEISATEVWAMIETNLTAPILLTKALWPELAKKSGTVINIGSLAGRSGGAGESLYAAVKAGLEGFSNALQFDASSAGMKVIHASLGALNTDMTAGRKDQVKFIDPDEAAKVIVLLCENYRTLRITSFDLKRRLY